MNKQRKVLITITYNEMGVIIDTKTVELGSSAQPEPCEDTISRQAAIDVLDAYQVKIENGEENPYAWARLRMSELPSVTPEQQWIPVTERLPEKSTDVLICNSVGTIKIRSLESSYDGMWYWESSEGEYEGLSEAIAWMPLPKCKGDAE